MTSISAIINTFNEEHNIRECLETLKWVDEIILVDMHSDDSTVEIAREYTQNIYFYERMGYVEPARNFAIQQATKDWILIVDADERVPEALAADIRRVIENPVSHVAFRIPIQDFMFGKWIKHGIWKYQKLIRLFKRGTCHWPEMVHSQPTIDGSTGHCLEHPILHFSHLTVSKFIMKLNTYTDIEAQDLYDKGIRKNLFLGFLASIRKFLMEFFVFQGFRDRGHGFLLAVLMALYTFSTRAKLWVLWYKHDHNSAF